MDNKIITTRNILLLVTGTTAQVVTETLCALIHESESYIPSEIHVITTKKGEEEIISKLFNEHILEAFCNEYSEFFEKNYYRLSEHEDYESENDTSRNFFIHRIKQKNGEVLFDIRSSEDSEAAGDAIMNIIKKLCEDHDARLHVSIAGGRKTMGFYAGHALSLFGQNNNVLSHVLASEEFEKSREYYPTRKQLTDNPKIIELAHIPVVMMGRNLPEYFIRYDKYSDIVNRIQRSFVYPYSLSFDIPNCKLICNDVEIHLAPQLFSMYMTVLREAQTHLNELFEIDFDFLKTYILVRDFVEECKTFKKEYAFNDSSFELVESKLPIQEIKEGKNEKEIEEKAGLTVCNWGNIHNKDIITEQFFSSIYSCVNKGQVLPYYQRIKKGQPFSDENCCFLSDAIFEFLVTSIRESSSKIQKELKKYMWPHELDIFRFYGNTKQNSFKNIHFNFDKVQIDYKKTLGILSSF